MLDGYKDAHLEAHIQPWVLAWGEGARNFPLWWQQGAMVLVGWKGRTAHI